MARPVGRPPDSPLERFRRHVAAADAEQLAYLHGYMEAVFAARRDELRRGGGKPARISPAEPVELPIAIEMEDDNG